MIANVILHAFASHRVTQSFPYRQNVEIFNDIKKSWVLDQDPPRRSEGETQFEVLLTNFSFTKPSIKISWQIADGEIRHPQIEVGIFGYYLCLKFFDLITRDLIRRDSPPNRE